MNDFTEFAPLRYDSDAVKRQGWGMASSGPGDDGLVVGFYKRSVLNAAQSREQGHPVHESRDYVKIEIPGERLNKLDRPVQDSDKLRWPRQWAQYQAGVHQIPDGIPLSLLFPDKPHIADMMRGYNIHTVEQLAKLSAQAISTVGMGCQEWVNAAQRYMERAEKGVNHHQFENMVSELKSEIAKLQRQNAELASMVRQQAQHQQQAPNPQNFDLQTMQLNASHQSNEPFTPPPAQFHTDLSSEVQPQQKRRPGRPRKIQEH